MYNESYFITNIVPFDNSFTVLFRPRNTITGIEYIPLIDSQESPSFTTYDPFVLLSSPQLYYHTALEYQT